LVQDLLGNFAALYPLVHEIAIKTFPQQESLTNSIAPSI